MVDRRRGDRYNYRIKRVVIKGVTFYVAQYRKVYLWGLIKYWKNFVSTKHPTVFTTKEKAHDIMFRCLVVE